MVLCCTRSALRDKSSSSPPYMRHTSFDFDSVASYNSRDNHSPLSAAFQEYLDQSSLTCSSSNSSLSSRSPTPAPSASRSSSRSISRTSSTSTNDDKFVKRLQQTIHQQQQQLEQQQQQIAQLQQQLLQSHNQAHGQQPQQQPQQHHLHVIDMTHILRGYTSLSCSVSLMLIVLLLFFSHIISCYMLPLFQSPTHISP